MRLALQQAENRLGNTKDNPAVGCVITKNNHLISVGSTGTNGRPHAEKNAIHSSKTKRDGSELYTTLEPCSHYGKTPPCTNIIKSKLLNSVYYSKSDPDKRSFKKAKIILSNYGINVFMDRLFNTYYYT